jgi:hypothetical protein
VGWKKKKEERIRSFIAAVFFFFYSSPPAPLSLIPHFLVLSVVWLGGGGGVS